MLLTIPTEEEIAMNIPGFTAEQSLGPTTGMYRGRGVLANFPSQSSRGVVPQLGLPWDPDLGAYLRCRRNGGSDLICRFFAGLPPFTIGGLLT
jgi:hypothetical protein